ncbi:probable transporter Mch4p [[Candida] railenensis]|uniref:Probable transporter Mch4p n=1 Tax=[Candida] railenensis TaxID=45579 RepID=A0A9P0QQ03_9ASCO|nr:probable transporter Mch4p [[Candida] railenensis]
MSGMSRRSSRQESISLNTLDGLSEISGLSSQHTISLHTLDEMSVHESGLRSRRGTTVLSTPKVDISLNLMYQSEKNPEEFPDGGTEAYIVVLGSFIGLIIDFGIANSLGAIESYVSSNQLKDVSQTSVSWIFSLHLGVMYFGGVFFGSVFDRFGARPPMIVGTLLMCLGLLFTAESTKVYQFILSFGVLTALGTSLGMQPLIGVLSHWFLRKRGMACSLATIGGLVGSAVFAIMLQNLYVSIGFKWAIRVLTLIGFICMATSTLLIKERTFEKSEDEGEVNKTTMQKLKLFGQFFREALDFSMVKDIKFVLLTTSVALSELISMSTLTYLSSFAIFYGVDEKQAYLLITIINACGIPSRLASGYLADKYGRFNVMIVTSIFVTISIFGLWLPAKGNVAVLYAFGVLFGISTSAVISLIPACCGQICSSDNFGKVYGTLYFFLAFSTLLGMYLSSLVVGTGKDLNYMNLVYYEGALSIGSTITWILARCSSVGWKWAKF